MGGTAEVLREALEHDLVVAAPRHEAEGARADRMAREAGPALVRLLARHDRRGVVGHQVQERRERPLQAQLYGAVVHHAHAGDLRGAALDELARAGQLVEHPRPLAARRALERVLHVRGADLAPVVEFRAPAEVERIDAVVGGHAPALGQRGRGHQLLVQLQQRVEHLVDDRGRGEVGRVRRIERRRVGDEDHPQRAARAGGHGRAGERGHEEDEEQRGGRRRAGHEPGSSVTVLRR